VGRKTRPLGNREAKAVEGRPFAAGRVFSAGPQGPLGMVRQWASVAPARQGMRWDRPLCSDLPWLPRRRKTPLIPSESPVSLLLQEIQAGRRQAAESL
jgi:hypothetical protein